MLPPDLARIAYSYTGFNEDYNAAVTKTNKWVDMLTTLSRYSEWDLPELRETCFMWVCLRHPNRVVQVFANNDHELPTIVINHALGNDYQIFRACVEFTREEFGEDVVFDM